MNTESASPNGINHALIIAAGRGSRFKSETEGRPKPLIEVNGIPLILHVIKSAGAAGINVFTIVTGYLGGVLEDYLARKAPEGMQVRFVRNEHWERPNGISVLKAKGLMPRAFALLMSDHFFDPGILRELASVPLPDGFCRLGVDFNIPAITDLEDATKVLAAEGRVLEIGKTIDNYNAVDTGVFLCTAGIFEALEKSITRGEESLSDAVRELARRGKMEARDIGGLFWRDIDDQAGLLDAALKNKFPGNPVVRL
jgi:1L-myo-inositol 1-phosphate cytidylyltransferase